MRARLRSEYDETSSPARRYEPPVGRSRQPRIFRSDDFPDPDAPRIVTNSPAEIEILTLRNGWIGEDAIVERRAALYFVPSGVARTDDHRSSGSISERHTGAFAIMTYGAIRNDESLAIRCSDHHVRGHIRLQQRH